MIAFRFVSSTDTKSVKRLVKYGVKKLLAPKHILHTDKSLENIFFKTESAIMITIE